MSDLVNRLRQRIEQVLGRDNNVLEYPDELCAEAAARIEALEWAVQELALLMDDIVAGEYEPDSFTTQPAWDLIPHLASDPDEEPEDG